MSTLLSETMQEISPDTAQISFKTLRSDIVSQSVKFEEAFNFFVEKDRATAKFLEENLPSQNNAYLNQLNLQMKVAADWTFRQKVLEGIYKRTVALQDEAYDKAISDLLKLHSNDKVAVELPPGQTAEAAQR